MKNIPWLFGSPLTADTKKKRVETGKIQRCFQTLTLFLRIKELIQQNKVVFPTFLASDMILMLTNQLWVWLWEVIKLHQVLSYLHLTFYRINFLQSLVAEHGQFDELLLRFSDWIKQFLAELQATSEINTADQQLAASHNKVNF